MKLTRFLLLSLVPIAVVACDDDDDGTGLDDVALVRIVNATNNVSDVNVTLGGSPLLSQGLATRGSNATCVEVPAGNQTFNVTSGGTNVTATPSGFNFQAGERYTVVLSNSGASRVVTVLEDDETPAAGNNAIRAFNASATAGDVYIFVPGGAMGTPAFGNLSVVGTSNTAPTWVNRGTNETSVRFFNVGTTTGTPRAELTLPTLTNRTATVVFLEAGTPPGPTAFVVQPCA